MLIAAIISLTIGAAVAAATGNVAVGLTGATIGILLAGAISAAGNLGRREPRA